VLAILAGGLVLGVGAAVTLAVWNDSEFATGTFTSTSFDFVGSNTDSAYSSHATAPGNTLSFSTNFNNMSPDTIVYAPYFVKTTTGSAAGTMLIATFDHTDVSGSSNETHLAWDVYQLASTVTACDVAGVADVGTTLLASGATFVDNAAVNLPAGGVALVADTPIPLCIVVTAGTQASGFQQGSVTTGTWEFKATSDV
jgi:predicted ribosomally synthesized peptide with SipW-like signal peptide